MTIDPLHMEKPDIDLAVLAFRHKAKAFDADADALALKASAWGPQNALAWQATRQAHVARDKATRLRAMADKFGGSLAAEYQLTAVMTSLDTDTTARDVELAQ